MNARKKPKKKKVIILSFKPIPSEVTYIEVDSTTL